MPNSFDHIIERPGTSCLKYDARKRTFGKADVIPMWVADMDFAVPDAVQRAVAERASHPIYGYSIFPESLYQALINWLSARHGWRVEREWIVLSPGVNPSLHASIIALTDEGASVIVQPPIYPPFLSAPAATGRKLITNPLMLVNGTYRFDLEHFEKCIDEGVRLLLLCSPHNPVGRVWREDELRALIAICARHNVTIISDEIHSDLIYPEYKHTPLALLSHGAINVITAIAPSKTFNIPGLGLSALIVQNKRDRDAIIRAFGTLHVSANNPFGMVAFEAAYREGAPWLGELLAYLADTRDFVRTFIKAHLPRITLIEPEGTYLLWLDCRAMGLTDSQLNNYFINTVGLGLSPGVLFGEQGSGFMRMNIGAPRSLVVRALEQIALAEQLSCNPRKIY